MIIDALRYLEKFASLSGMYVYKEEKTTPSPKIVFSSTP